MKKLIDAFGIDEYGFAEYPNKMSYVRILQLQNQLCCIFCKPHRGCNRRRRSDRRNWKQYRGTQYRVK